MIRLLAEKNINLSAGNGFFIMKKLSVFKIGQE